ncbi:GntR family transcriptional regulator [Helcobacillus massiliensis]|uniref:DNA-binding GntR family transcriptional regulator n=1 Tax=Helcobacillus massiliensis TaxID=521392 RepID=A0A839QRN8_9MICO|nr:MULTISPECIES: GntR family transcriptional regulator [Helcobacillus]MBB3022964.1 DNA-binding GntR family transcriptional regulator [Helcobacillus massiliensis]MCG7426187.1 GntR family transcriptional regulator [Helcobacillus sp. ACRRO]MCT1558319.1 GntR family transcriptional regulator [Helcobacillus massiliensis]MCT2037332.1 GntR family transcriptional regulator [Helcobacillus massiliensis]MCT2332352.1 GntR family transcriptional regulator [Helcobacillus massiliensis]
MTARPPHRDTRSASSRAAASLRAQISAGRLLPGSKLSEVAVAAELGISRNTLREAFATLAQENLIDRRPHRGVCVARPDQADVREIYEARLAVEPSAVLWGEVTDQLAARQESVLAAAQEALGEGRMHDVGDQNQLFHDGLVQMTGSTIVMGAMDQLLARMRLMFLCKDYSPTFHANYVHRNAELWAMVMQGRRRDAAEELRRYLVDARTEVLDFLGYGAQAPRR